MVPAEGGKSNSEGTVSKALNKDNQAPLEALDMIRSDQEVEQLFETLADWNTYLEKHVPTLKGPRL